jgi:hypothetical protein
MGVNERHDRGGEMMRAISADRAEIGVVADGRLFLAAQAHRWAEIWIVEAGIKHG